MAAGSSGRCWPSSCSRCALRLTRAPGTRGGALVLIGAAGLGWMVAEGLSVGLRGWNWGQLEMMFGPVTGQPAFGAGAVVLALAFTGLIAFGFAERGALKGDAFVLGAIAVLILLVATFVFYPLISMFSGAFQDFDGSFTTAGVARNIGDPKIWSLALPRGRLLRRRLADLFPGLLHGHRGDGARSRLRAGRDTDRLPLQEVAAPAHRAADHHAALRRRACPHPSAWPLGHADPV